MTQTALAFAPQQAVASPIVGAEAFSPRVTPYSRVKHSTNPIVEPPSSTRGASDSERFESVMRTAEKAGLSPTHTVPAVLAAKSGPTVRRTVPPAEPSEEFKPSVAIHQRDSVKVREPLTHAPAALESLCPDSLLPQNLLSHGEATSLQASPRVRTVDEALQVARKSREGRETNAHVAAALAPPAAPPNASKAAGFKVPYTDASVVVRRSRSRGPVEVAARVNPATDPFFVRADVVHAPEPVCRTKIVPPPELPPAPAPAQSQQAVTSVAQDARPAAAPVAESALSSAGHEEPYLCERHAADQRSVAHSTQCSAYDDIDSDPSIPRLPLEHLDVDADDRSSKLHGGSRTPSTLRLSVRL